MLQKVGVFHGHFQHDVLGSTLIAMNVTVLVVNPGNILKSSKNVITRKRFHSCDPALQSLLGVSLSDFRWLKSRPESRFSGQIYTVQSTGAGQQLSCFRPSEVTKCIRIVVIRFADFCVFEKLHMFECQIPNYLNLANEKLAMD